MKKSIKSISLFMILVMVVSLFQVIPVLAEQTITIKTPVNEGMSVEIQDFNTLSNDYAEFRTTKDSTLSSENLIAFSDEFGWTLSSNKHFGIKRIAGASGDSGDYALAVYPDQKKQYGIGSAAGKQTEISMVLNGWNQMAEEGLVTVEFKVALSPADYMCADIKGIHSYHGCLTFEDSSANNKWTLHNISDYEFNDGEWVKLKYAYDTETEKCYTYINNNLIESKSNVASPAKDYMDMSHFELKAYIGGKGDTAIVNRNAYFAIDDFSVYVEKKFNPTSEKYTIGSKSFDTNGQIMQGADSVEITFNNNFDNFDVSKVSVNDVAASSASFAGGKLTVSLPDNLKAGDALNITLDKTLTVNGTPLGKDIVYTYTVSAKPESSFSVSDCNFTDGTFTCNFNSVNYDEGINASLIVAAYNGNELLNISTYPDETVAIGTNSKPLTLSGISDDATMVKVFVWDGMTALKPLTGDTEYPITK